MIRRQNALRSPHRRSHRQQATVYTPTGTEAAETARNALTTAPEGTERAGALALDPEEAEDLPEPDREKASADPTSSRRRRSGDPLLHSLRHHAGTAPGEPEGVLRGRSDAATPRKDGAAGLRLSGKAKKGHGGHRKRSQSGGNSEGGTGTHRTRKHSRGHHRRSEWGSARSERGGRRLTVAAAML